MRHGACSRRGKSHRPWQDGKGCATWLGLEEQGKDRAVVHHIRTRIRTVRDGQVRADEIVRMYGRIVRERTIR